ncbi:MAG: DNA cytosine methyltransferase [Pyrinomonadaceae bacterium]
MDVPSVPTISLFSGCGGTDSALEKAGYDIVWANDIWSVAGDIYDLNMKGCRMTVGDISGFNTFPSAELLVGCYPCQSYSQAGSRNWNSNTNFLYRQYDRVLRVIKPRAFVVENVNGMAFGQNYNLLMNQVYRYRLAGYRVKWSVLNAKAFGVAQNRRRIFLVGIRSDVDFNYEFPQPTHGPGTKNKYVSQRDVIGNMPAWPEGEFNDEPFHWYYLSRKRRNTWSEPSACIVGNWRHVPLHPSSPPLRRINTDCWEFTRNGRARRLSYRECAALQGFDPKFHWGAGKVRDRFQAIGNAVPPPLFAAVLQPLREIWN